MVQPQGFTTIPGFGVDGHDENGNIYVIRGTLDGATGFAGLYSTGSNNEIIVAKRGIATGGTGFS